MKKLMFAILAMLPMALVAQNYHKYYNSLHPYPTPAQVVSEQVRIEKNAFYEQVLEQTQAESERIMYKIGESNKKVEQEAHQLLQRQANATPKQKQAQQAMAGDMMQIIQELGIPMEKLEEMSEEEIEALVMPKVAANTGLSPEVMEKLSKMSDREAEAYMKAHPELMSSFQNSRFGQQAMDMQGMARVEEAGQADMDRLNRLMELNNQVIEARLGWASDMSKHGNWGNGKAFSQEFTAPYYERITEIYLECWSRVEREDPVTNGDYSERPTPAFVRSYYDRMNAVVDEANQALADKWCKMLQEDVVYYRNEIEKLLPICDEQHRIYNKIQDPSVRIKADGTMADGAVYSAIQLYVHTLQHRLDIITLEHRETPKTYVPGGGKG